MKFHRALNFHNIIFVSRSYLFLNFLSFLDFSNRVENDKLARLAEADVHNVITQLQEVYLDYQAINPHLFSLDVPSVIGMSMRDKREWTHVDDLSFDRITAGLYSVLMSVRG